jgi:hypothetical protein
MEEIGLFQRYWPGIRLDELRKNMENLNHDVRYPGVD